MTPLVISLCISYERRSENIQLIIRKSCPGKMLLTFSFLKRNSASRPLLFASVLWSSPLFKRCFPSCFNSWMFEFCCLDWCLSRVWHYESFFHIHSRRCKFSLLSKNLILRGASAISRDQYWAYASVVNSLGPNGNKQWDQSQAVRVSTQKIKVCGSFGERVSAVVRIVTRNSYIFRDLKRIPGQNIIKCMA